MWNVRNVVLLSFPFNVSYLPIAGCRVYWKTKHRLEIVDIGYIKDVVNKKLCVIIHKMNNHTYIIRSIFYL